MISMVRSNCVKFSFVRCGLKISLVLSELFMYAGSENGVVGVLFHPAADHRILTNRMSNVNSIVINVTFQRV